MMYDSNNNLPTGGIAPEKLVGKDIHTVTQIMDTLNIKYRVVRERGLITADYDPERYTLQVDEELVS